MVPGSIYPECRAREHPKESKDSSISDQTEHCAPYLRNKTTESLRVKSGTPLNSKKALDA